MRLEINARGLTQEEIQNAIDMAYELKQPGALQNWEEKRQSIISELLTVDDEMALIFLKNIKERRPDLLKEI